MAALAFLLLSVLFFTTLTSASISLNVTGLDWSYTASSLLNTTSLACKTAYSAPIDCTYTLVGITASMRGAYFKPTPADFDAMCVPTCKESLAAYVKNVQEVCTAPGDKALEAAGGSDWIDMFQDPVELVGQILQYSFAQYCGKRSQGTYCHFERLEDSDKFACIDECAIHFYQTAHDWVASAYMFQYYVPTSRGSWWADEFAAGWERLKKCGKAVEISTSSQAATSSSTAVSLVGSSSTGSVSATMSAVAKTTPVSPTITATVSASQSVSTAQGTAKSSGASFQTSILLRIWTLAFLYATLAI